MSEKYKPSPKEILGATTQRTLSDAELIKGGAEYVLDDGNQEPRLEPAKKQISEIKKEAERRTKMDQKNLEMKQKLESLGIKSGDQVYLKHIEDYKHFPPADREAARRHWGETGEGWYTFIRIKDGCIYIDHHNIGCIEIPFESIINIRK